MAIPGDRFELDLESDDFAYSVNERNTAPPLREIREHEVSDIPPPPSLKSSRTGFPAHKTRHTPSAFKTSRAGSNQQADPDSFSKNVHRPSDRAIRQQIGQKYGVDFEAQQKAEISQENVRRLAELSPEELEQARAELTNGLSPALVERLLRRANIDEDQTAAPSLERTQPAATEPASALFLGDQDPGESMKDDTEERLNEEDASPPSEAPLPEGPSVHFPVPPRAASDFKPLNPDSDTFLEDLRSTYFPELAHDPSSLSWLQDPSPEDDQNSSYNPDLTKYPASSLRFDFHGRLIPPKEALKIPVTAGLHHHGEAPNSAGYTIPELTLLARSVMPNQRCIAYQTVGRTLYRLGKGQFGQRGGEVDEAIWDIVEHERILELIMAEANRQKGHASAKAYATEALWLWRKGGASDRGLLKTGEQRAK